MSPSWGSKWMSETPRSTASVMIRCTSWMTDASSPADVKSIGLSSRTSYIGPPAPWASGLRSGTSLLLVVEVEQHRGVVGVLEALEQPLDVLARGDRRADLVAGHDGDVVDREHVGGVRHGHQQRAVGDERDRHGLIALDRRRGHELGGVGVDLVVAQRDVIEAEALCHGAPELVLGDRSLGQEHPLSRRSGGMGLRDGLVHHRPVDELEVDEDVRQHPAGAATTRRGRNAPFCLGRRGPGLSGRIHGLGDVVTAPRIAWRGAILPVQRSKDATPCATRISNPSTTRAPRDLAIERNRVSSDP